MPTGWYAKHGDPALREVYALLQPGSRRPRYVGMAQDAEVRVKAHWQQRADRTTRVAEWLRTLDARPEVWVIQTVPIEQGPAAEKYWIHLLNEVLGDLLNVIYTPEASVIGKAARSSPEVRARMSAAMKGRKPASYDHARGEHCPSAKLTEDDVRVIRASSDSLRVLAARYGVSFIAIRNVRLGLTWKHVE